MYIFQGVKECDDACGGDIPSAEPPPLDYYPSCPRGEDDQLHTWHEMILEKGAIMIPAHYHEISNHLEFKMSNRVPRIILGVV